MRENTQECIKNCLNTTLDTHLMYRDFGLNVVDSATFSLRKDVLVQLSTYYPNVALNNVQIISNPLNGTFNYNIEIKNEV